MTQDRDLLDDFRDISGWSAVASGQAQLTLGSDAGPAGEAGAATRFRLQGRWRLRRGAQEPCAPDAGGVGIVAARARRRAGEQARDQVRGSERPQRLVVASRRVRLPGRLAAAAHPQQRGGVRLGAGGRRNDARARRARNRDRCRAGRSRHGIGVRPALRGPLARGPAARHCFEQGPGARAGARPPSLAGDELAQRGRRVARVARARLRPRARVRRPRDRLGGPRRRPRLRSAMLRTTAPRGRRSRPRPRPRANAATSTCRAADARGICGCSCTRPLQAVRPHEIRLLDVRPFDFSRSLAEFFHAVAACEPRGHHPRWLHREQSYWTPAGIAGGDHRGDLERRGPASSPIAAASRWSPSCTWTAS